jgi:hypothetical protein
MRTATDIFTIEPSNADVAESVGLFANNGPRETARFWFVASLATNATDVNRDTSVTVHETLAAQLSGEPRPLHGAGVSGDSRFPSCLTRNRRRGVS